MHTYDKLGECHFSETAHEQFETILSTQQTAKSPYTPRRVVAGRAKPSIAWPGLAVVVVVVVDGHGGASTRSHVTILGKMLRKAWQTQFGATLESKFNHGVENIILGRRKRKKRSKSKSIRTSEVVGIKRERKNGGSITRSPAWCGRRFSSIVLFHEYERRIEM